MTPAKNIGLNIMDYAMCELAKPKYVPNQFANILVMMQIFCVKMTMGENLVFVL